VLERSQFTVILDVNTRLEHGWGTINYDDHAEIETTSVSVSADKFRFTGQGQQTCNVSFEGRCRITGGVPFTVPAQVTIETDGLTAEVRFKITGTMPSLRITCHTRHGTKHVMSMPLPTYAPKIPMVRMPLKDGAEVVIDMSDMVSRPGFTNKAIVRLVCHKL
jgi:hypothetical protein